ncbi:hypothetical protein LTR49_027917, partial [Elasticomyces elasticus]
EGQTGKIELKTIGESDDDAPHDDLQAIKLMVDFFYHLDYNAEPLELTPVLDTPELLSPTKEMASDDDDHDVRSSLASSRKSKRCTPCGLPKDRSNDGRHTAATSKSTADECESSDGNTVMRAKVLAAAFKYQIPAVQKLAASKFSRAAKINWNDSSFAEATRIAYTIRCSGSKRDYGPGNTHFNWQASHSPWTAGSIYARGLEEVARHVATRKAEYRTLSIEWHHSLNFQRPSLTPWKRPLCDIRSQTGPDPKRVKAGSEKVAECTIEYT